MLGRLKRFKPRPVPVLGLCLVVLVGALYYGHARLVALGDASKNYKLFYSPPPGWTELPHSPQAIFLFQDPKTHLLLRAAMSDVVSDSNPTPDLDRDGTARLMLDITSENLVGWNGQLLDLVDARGATFRMIRRWNPTKCVVTAVAVRGNTTIIVTLSADKAQLSYVDAAMPQFRQYLSSLEFRRHIWQN